MLKFTNILFLLLACAIPLTIFLFPILGLEKAVKKLDWYSPFYVFTLQFAIATLLFLKLSKDFAEWLKSLELNPKSLIPVFIITLVAILICLFWIEGRSRVQADESIYRVVAQNLYYNQTGSSCHQGVFADGNFECFPSGTIKPRGLSYLYMLGMPIFGTDLRWVYNFQTFILFLTLPIFFLAILAWTKKQWLALLTITLLANCPVLLLCSRSASIEGLYVFMFALSLLFLKWACDRNTTRHWILLALTLAFLAQSRSEALFCLGAFIGVAFHRICLNQDFQDSRIYRIFKFKFAPFSILNSRFSIFLVTLSAFSLPVLCTLSLNRNSDLQGGAYGARGHLLSNIITDFKIMAFTNYTSEGFFYSPYFPYFTWFALIGLITLMIKCLNRKSLDLRIFRNIAIFLLLLSPQYIILFDSVSADLNLDVQQRFVLIILPAMSFLGALFIWQMFMNIKNLVNPLILIILVQTIILANTIIHHGSFKNVFNNIHKNNASLVEHYELQKWTSKLEAPAMFFAYIPTQLIDKGLSAYDYNLLVDVEENALDDLLKIYNGNVFIIENSQCKHSHSVSKMISNRTSIKCESITSYFDVDTVLNVNLVENTGKTLLIYKILGLNERDKKGLLRIFDIYEMRRDSIDLIFRIPKDTSVSWKVEHFLNDEFIKDTPYRKGYFADNFKLSQFTQSTNIWRLDIIDTITNEKIYSTSIPLEKTGN